MNILIVTEVFWPENFLINDFARAMVERGHHLSVMTRQPSYPDGHVFPGYKNEKLSIENWDGVEIHRFEIVDGYRESKVKKIQNYYHYVKRGKEVITSLLSDVDVILVHQTGPLSVALPAIYAKKNYAIPVVVWTFDIWPDHVYMYGFPRIPPISTLVNSIIRKVYSNADAVLVSSKHFADSIHEYFPEMELTYAPNWLIKTEEKETTLGFDMTKINFVFTGNISHAQNIENTIRGFAKANIENAVLNIVGHGTTYEHNKKVAEELGCKNVIFHGRVAYNEIQSVLSKNDFLVLPLTPKAGIDKTEPFKIQSYIKSGKPILGIIRGSGKEIIEENHLGYCCNPVDVDDIARGFKKMLTLTQEDKKCVKASSINLMNTRFCRESIINTVENMLMKFKK